MLAEPEFLLGQHVSTLKGKEKQVMPWVAVDGRGEGAASTNRADSSLTDLSVF